MISYVQAGIALLRKWKNEGVADGRGKYYVIYNKYCTNQLIVMLSYSDSYTRENSPLSHISFLFWSNKGRVFYHLVGLRYTHDNGWSRCTEVERNSYTVFVEHSLTHWQIHYCVSKVVVLLIWLLTSYKKANRLIINQAQDENKFFKNTPLIGRV